MNCSCCLGPSDAPLQLFDIKINQLNSKVTGKVNRKSTSWKEYFAIKFQNLEFIEKHFEIIDESFHLIDKSFDQLGGVFRECQNSPAYQFFSEAHHSAHFFEHFLHAGCFFGDLTRLYFGNFFQDQNNKKLTYLQSLSRISHATAHFFATADFLHDWNFCSLDRFSHIFQFTHVLSASSYALGAISLVWERCHSKKNDYFVEDMCINITGCVFETSLALNNVKFIYPGLNFALSTTGSLAGIIHALLIVKRLQPKEIENVEGNISLCFEATGRRQRKSS